MIGIDQLYQYINNFLSTNINVPTVIYFAIGSENFNKEWTLNENQQFPPFLHDFKIKNFDSKILVILIDPLLNTIPYIVRDNTSFLTNSWEETQNNVYISNTGVEVIAINSAIIWDTRVISDVNLYHYDITDLMIKLCILVNQFNTVLFYHEFTGYNIILLEKILKKFITKNKVCIDITRGINDSCYIDLSKPENYPLIEINDNIISYINIDNIDEDHKKYLINKYKEKINSDIDFRFNNEFLLFHQIIKKDYYNITLFKNIFITMIRQNYTVQKFDDIAKMLDTSTFILCKYFFDKYKKQIKIFIKVLSENNYNSKNILQDNLFLFLKDYLKDFGYKYSIQEKHINNLITNIQNIDDKYKINPIFDSFCNKRFINVS
jgi:hypothetical protein